MSHAPDIPQSIPSHPSEALIQKWDQLIQSGVLNQRMKDLLIDVCSRSAGNMEVLKGEFFRDLSISLGTHVDGLRTEFERTFQKVGNDSVMLLRAVSDSATDLSLEKIQTVVPIDIMKAYFEEYRLNTDNWLDSYEEKKGLISLAISMMQLKRGCLLSGSDPNVREQSTVYDDMKAFNEGQLGLYPSAVELRNDPLGTKTYPFTVYGILKKRMLAPNMEELGKGLKHYGSICFQAMVDQVKDRAVYYHGDPFFGGKWGFQRRGKIFTHEDGFLTARDFYEMMKEKSEKVAKILKSSSDCKLIEWDYSPAEARMKAAQLSFQDALVSFSLAEFAKSKSSTLLSEYDTTEAQILGSIRFPQDLEKIYVQHGIKEYWEGCLKVMKKDGMMNYQGKSLAVGIFDEVFDKTTYIHNLIK